MTDQQKEFIWMAFADKIPYATIEKELNVTRKELSEWTKELENEWRPISNIKSIHNIKKIEVDFRTFYDWYKLKEQNKKCEYCNITESEIKLMFENDPNLTKRGRGRKLELDRKQPNVLYNDLENIVFACYWCNNAKTDTFTHEEFLEVGKVFESIWKKRLQK